jgi:hypothetical protein
LPEHVLATGFVTIRRTPVFRYVQYLCEGCRQVGEKLLACPEQLGRTGEPAWELPPLSAAEGQAERDWLEETRGPISAEEISEFARTIRRVRAADFARLRQSLIP